MQLTSLGATHFLNHRSLNVAIHPASRVLFVVGDNGSGKTGLAQGIKLALTGQPVRGLTYKNQLDALITHGEKDGYFSVGVQHADGTDLTYKLALKTGNYAGSSPELPGHPLPLDPAAFVTMPASDRRKLLFALAGIQLKPEAIIEALVCDGHALQHVQYVAPKLRGGFDATVKGAEEAAAEARGGWRAITGETYGARKAETWKASAPEAPSKVPLAQLQSEEAAARAAVDTTKATLDSVRSAATMHESAGRATAAKEALPGQRLHLATLEADAAALQKEHDALSAAASYKGGQTHPCPACNTMLFWSTVGVLQKWDDAKPAIAPPAAQQALEGVRAQLVDLRSQIARAQSAVRDGEAAADMLANLPEKPAPGAVREAETAHGKAQAALVVAQVELNGVVNAQQEAAKAAERTEQAAGYHADVLAYQALAGAIADLPAKYLSKAMAQVQALLDQANVAFDRPVTLGEDMELRYGQVPYGLASESQQWRMLAAIGYALAVMGKLGVLVLDRFDMVQVRSRGAILKWLSQQQQVQVVLLATLKEVPKLPEPAFQILALDAVA